jgi:hypothetical protein
VGKVTETQNTQNAKNTHWGAAAELARTGKCFIAIEKRL